MARPNTRMTGTRKTGPDIYASERVLSNFLRNNTSKADVDGIEYGLDGIRVGGEVEHLAYSSNKHVSML